ncbi:MAG: hypothetical protein LRZ92_04950 [Methanosarcinaceae archaeon]|jgi:hypothetical protein|nr:hypothetical protein [Methanosarcinaceae archaeon]
MTIIKKIIGTKYIKNPTVPINISGATNFKIKGNKIPIEIIGITNLMI